MLSDNLLYQKVNKNVADTAAIWWIDYETGEQFIAHSAEVNPNGTYNQKSDYGSVETNVTESQFTAGHLPTVPGDSYEIKYYKKNY